MPSRRAKGGASNAARAAQAAMRSDAALAWVDIDPDYASRGGYDPGFLGRGLSVPLPRVDGRRLKAAALTATLKYHHFSLRLHKRRRLAAFTAVNIDGAERYPRTGRTADSWEFDPRAVGYQTGQPFYRRPFQRGHLVMRLDPVWGPTRIAELAEADTFHWSNCAPQHARLNNPRWLAVENHVLETADVTDARVCVFAGPVLHPRDPVLREVRVPLAYWKVVAWRAPGRGGGLRSLGFVVRQDAEVRAAIDAAAQARGVHLALDFPDTPARVKAYQVLVSEVERLTGLRFGRLAAASVDAFARQEAAEPLAAAAGRAASGVRALSRLEELVVG